MGKGDPVENYYVKQNDEWVPIYIKGGPKSQKVPRSSGSSSEEYFVQRDGKWVKVSGINGAADLMSKMYISSPQGSSAVPMTVLQAPVEQTQVPIMVAPVPSGPMEYHEYIITVKPPSQPVLETVEVIAPPANPRRIPRQPFVDRAVPNDYADGPILPQRAPIYREPSRPAALRRRPPSPRFDSPRRHCTPPPPPIPEPPLVYSRDNVDAYEMGKEAYYRENARGVDYVEDSYGCDDEPAGVPRTTPAPGYYLAGYIYYGNPSQPAPKLEPVSASGAVQCPPGHYLAGYTS
jgi:hypothetical protein